MELDATLQLVSGSRLLSSSRVAQASCFHTAGEQRRLELVPAAVQEDPQGDNALPHTGARLVAVHVLYVTLAERPCARKLNWRLKHRTRGDVGRLVRRPVDPQAGFAPKPFLSSSSCSEGRSRRKRSAMRRRRMLTSQVRRLERPSKLGTVLRALIQVYWTKSSASSRWRTAR